MNLVISGMHCGACVARVKSALAPLVASAQVEVGRASLLPKAGVELDAINRALARVGSYVATTAAAASGSAAPLANGDTFRLPVIAASGEAPSLKQVSDASGVGRAQASTVAAPTAPRLSTYRPVLMIVAFVFGTALVLQLRQRHFDASTLMTDFMGGFFVAFAFFKLLNWRGFVSAFVQYDWLGERLKAYAWAYPLIELGLGICYLLGPLGAASRGLHVFTLALMLLGGWGVWQALRKGQALRCACLGTVFNLPMSSVALIENLSMALMAAWMLV